MFDDNILDEVLDKIKKEIGIEKFDNTKILIEADDVTLKNVMILITCIMKEGEKFYPQIILEEALVQQN